MRLLLLTPQYPPTFGGAELQAQRLARVLDSRGIRVTILTQSIPGEALREQDGDIQIVRALAGLRVGPLWGLTYMSSSQRWLRRLANAWDIVQDQQVGLHSWASVRVAREVRRPAVLRFACSGQGGDLAVMRMRRFGPLLIRGLRDADGFIALTSEGASEIARHGLPAARVVTIPNGVDLEGFNVSSWPDLKDSDPIRLLFVGRLAHQKGVDVLLGALAKLKDRVAFTLRVVGIGDQLDRLRKQVHLAGLDDKVEFRGSLASVVQEYAWCELLVLPSRFEGMPNVALEALSCGRPVLGTRIGGTAELVEEGINGWLVPVEDGEALAERIARISVQRATLRSRGIEGRRIVEQRYSLEASVSGYVKLYERLLAARRSGPVGKMI